MKTLKDILGRIFQAKVTIDYGSTEKTTKYGKEEASYKLIGFGLDFITLGFHVTILV